MEAIRWEDSALYLLDQTRLPAAEDWLRYTDYRQVANAIQTMVVRGAPAIGITAAYAMVLAAQESAYKGDFPAAMSQAKAVLAASRPTAVNLFWALDRMERCWQTAGPDLPQLEEEARAIHREDIQMNEAMGKAGAELVPEGARILTHCNAGALATGGYGTALGVIRAAHAQGKVSMVYADETRPLLQGARLTAYELDRAGVDVTLICDNMASTVMKNGWVDACFVGCDRIAANGDTANKIGTSGVAILAKHYGIPFYVCAPSSTIDMGLARGEEIPIEERPPEEVTQLWYAHRMAPAGGTSPCWRRKFSDSTSFSACSFLI